MSRRIQWCPRCKKRCYQEDGGRVDNDNLYTMLADRLGQPTGGLERYAFLHAIFVKLFPDFPHVGGYFRYRKCSSCGETWKSVETPDVFFELLSTEVAKLQHEHESLQAECTELRERERLLRPLLESMYRVLQESRANSSNLAEPGAAADGGVAE